MKKWRVLLRGENFLVNLNGTPTKIGFYANRFTDAVDQETAEELAVAMVKADPELIQAVQNERNDTPMIYLEDIEEIMGYDTPGTGYTFFPDEDEPKNHLSS